MNQHLAGNDLFDFYNLAPRYYVKEKVYLFLPGYYDFDTRGVLARGYVRTTEEPQIYNPGEIMKRYTILMLCVFVSTTCSVQKSQIQVIETSEGFLFTEKDQYVLFYQRAPKSFAGKYTRNNYIHPLWSLEGDTLTEDYPPDHAHHRGIFWTWHQINVGETRLGDAWECRDFIWDVIDAQTVSNASSATLKVTVHWKSPDYKNSSGALIPAVEEKTAITVFTREDSHRFIDVGIQLLALQENVTLGGSEDEKGYGGFSTRIKCPEDLTFISSTGQVQPQNLAVTAGPWMDMIGHFSPDTKSGFAIYRHPGNPADLTQWILRQKRSMQNPVYPGRSPVPLSTNSPTILNYRLVVHGSDVQSWYDSYARENAP